MEKAEFGLSLKCGVGFWMTWDYPAQSHYLEYSEKFSLSNLGMFREVVGKNTEDIDGVVLCVQDHD